MRKSKFPEVQIIKILKDESSFKLSDISKPRYFSSHLLQLAQTTVA